LEKSGHRNRGYIHGLIASALYDWPTGTVIVVALLVVFIVAVAFSRGMPQAKTARRMNIVCARRIAKTAFLVRFGRTLNAHQNCGPKFDAANAPLATIESVFSRAGLETEKCASPAGLTEDVRGHGIFSEPRQTRKTRREMSSRVCQAHN